jgi:hypothetical protein
MSMTFNDEIRIMIIFSNNLEANPIKIISPLKDQISLKGIDSVFP